jgi:hypothetical protein
LFGALDVPSEQDHSRGLQPREQGTEPRLHFGAIEANDEQLPDFLETARFAWGPHL